MLHFITLAPFCGAVLPVILISLPSISESHLAMVSSTEMCVGFCMGLERCNQISYFLVC